jgi:hypothetical protein
MSNEFEGKKIVLTGTFATMKRSDAKKLLGDTDARLVSIAHSVVAGRQTTGYAVAHHVGHARIGRRRVQVGRARARKKQADERQEVGSQSVHVLTCFAGTLIAYVAGSLSVWRKSAGTPRP